jgi:hypothetical protein
LSLDYAVTENILIGARLGFVARTFPGVEPTNDGKILLPPLHGELRGMYLFGKNALSEQKLAPLVMLAAGVSPAAAGVDVPVSETGSPAAKNVTAYQVGGPGFAAAGGGLRVGLTPKFGLLIIPLKLNLAIGNGIILPSLQPEIGAHVGF